MLSRLHRRLRYRLRRRRMVMGLFLPRDLLR